MAFNLKKRKQSFSGIKKARPSGQEGGASPFTRLTPAEFAELFPKYYQKGLPDVGGFREAQSRKERQKLGLPSKPGAVNMSTRRVAFPRV